MTSLFKIFLAGTILSIPYFLILFFHIRNFIIEFFQKRIFLRSLIGIIGGAIYPIFITYFFKTNHPVVAFSLVYSYLIFLSTISYVNYRSGQNIDRLLAKYKNQLEETNKKNDILKKVNKLESYIRQLINSKSKRFLEAYTELNKIPLSELTGDIIFRKITKPDSQLKELYIIVKNVFQLIFCEPDEDLDYSIMEPVGEKLVFIAHSRVPRSLESTEYTSGEVFSKNSQCAATIAWGIQDIVIIEDIANEITKSKDHRRYQITSKHDHTTEVGSMISFPIFDKEDKTSQPDGLICVINITSKKPKVFNQQDKELYKYLIESFTCRLLLEKRLNSLVGLIKKEEVNNGSHAEIIK